MTDRERSFWGWGYEDKFPGSLKRLGLGVLARRLLGKGRLKPQRPPELGAIALAPPRVAPPARLAAICSASRRDRAQHCYGRSYVDLLRGFRGDFSSAPDFVARPTDETEIEQLMEWAASRRVALIPFGGGTSVVGGVEGVVPGGYRGVATLSLRALDRVLEVDPVSRAARIQAGCSGPELEAQLAEHRLTLRHFPQSFEFSTLGGWIATRAGGHFATVYTHIDDLVESVRMLSPSGPYESRRLPGSGAGPSPDRLVIGSEGTLGVITEAWMRVRERPRWRAQASVRFADFRTAVEATRAIAQSGLYPTNCRLLDDNEAALHRVASDGSQILLLGFESSDHPVDAWLERALAIAVAEHGGRCPEGARSPSPRSGAAGSWRRAFLEAPYLLNALVSLGVVADTFETSCTWDRFEALHTGVLAAVRAAMQEVAGGGFVSCRFTHVYPDGPAPYYTFLVPGRPGGELEQHAEIKRAASEALLEHGGTITHHHAVGRLHRPWYDRQRPELYARVLRAAKRELDPDAVLNPGVLIDPAASDAVVRS